MNTHRHRPQSSSDEPFRGPVAERQNEAAHGNICRVDRCSCGAVRRTNINGGHRERGPWAEDETRED